ncbi:MAG: cache domain-containing protein [Desulfobacterales bacterium]|nr:cache domain-containing protein [Desulfobacterales bacterium]
MKKVFLVMFFSLILCCYAYGENLCKKEEVVKAVEDSAAILEKEGREGLKKVGAIRFCGDNYIFVNNFEGVTFMHILPHLIGKNLIGLKDDTGKRFFVDFTNTAQSSKDSKNGTSYYNGSGWVSYRWPKLGTTEFIPKQTYIKGCLMEKENVYVGAGIYEK